VTDATFEVTVRPEDALAFATLSGDWNPLHTDAQYAAGTQFGRTILHGAFSAGIVSRMAGMHIPGKDCLLHGMQLKFLQPVLPPARLSVRGTLVHQRGDTGRVAVEISDADSGRRYVEAWYEYGQYGAAATDGEETPKRKETVANGVILVTGASGGLGKAVLARLGAAARGLSRDGEGDGASQYNADRIDVLTGGSPISAIIHCGWPAPDNTRLTKLGDIGAAVDYSVSRPLEESIALSRLLLSRGTSDAMMILVGSTAADPGRHNFRMPLYTIAKSVIPVLCRILAVELGSSGRRCAAAIFDVIDTGMNKGMSAQARLAHEDRSPAGRLPTADEAADQLSWMIANRSFLMSGATITLSGGALP
jgi:acyl dehydratase/NAD(P)-dependent dehydrogenase (short-subunit alcohol dehydrogenase family)